MFVVTVEFLIRLGQEAQFLARMHQQASDSLFKEAACRQFDVCISPDDPRKVFLYELYETEAAFRQHLESDHFKAFDQEAGNLIESKVVQTWQRTA